MINNLAFYVWEIDLSGDRTTVVGALAQSAVDAAQIIIAQYPDKGSLSERHDNLTIRYIAQNQPPDEIVAPGGMYVYSFSRY